MNTKLESLGRRRLLKGMLQGSAVSVGLPLLDMFLNDHGTAFANDQPLPVCFGTWYWGLGLCHGQWVPTETGADYQLRPQMAQLESVKEHINIYSGTQVMADGNSTLCHYSGQQCLMTGRIATAEEGFGRSVDDLIAEHAGGRTRFPLLSVSCDGDRTQNYSSRGGNNMNPAEISPVALYQRIFGADFVDPNAAEFTPDPAIMLRKSALSAVAEERHRLLKVAGSDDRSRLDEFFTALRSLERKLALELEKPVPLAACTVPGAPEPAPMNKEVNAALHTNTLFAELLAYALACGQTRVFNMTLSHNLVEAGDPTGFHMHTHEDTVDPVLGYQPRAFEFGGDYMKGFRQLIETLGAIGEGDGTLLDRVLVLAYSDHGDSRVHTLTEMPLMTAGRAGGRIKTGLHVSAPNEPCSRVTYTCLQALDLPIDTWGSGSNRTNRSFTEVLA